MIRIILCTAVISGFVASATCAQDKTELAKAWLKFLEGEWESTGEMNAGSETVNLGGGTNYEVAAGGLAVIGRGKTQEGISQALMLKILEDGSLHLSGAQADGLMWTVEFDDVSEDVLKGEVHGKNAQGEGKGTITWKRTEDGERVEESEVIWNGEPITWTSTSKKK